MIDFQELMQRYSACTDPIEEGLILLQIKNYAVRLWEQKDPSAEALLKWVSNEAEATRRTGIVESIRRMKSG